MKAEQALNSPTPLFRPISRNDLLYRGLIVLTLLVGTLQTLAGAQSSTLGLQQTNLVALGLGLAWLGFAFLISLQRPVVLVYAAAFLTFFTAWRPIDLPIGSFQASQLLMVLAVTGMIVRSLAGKQAGSGSIRLPFSLGLLIALVAVSSLLTGLIDPRNVNDLPILREGRSSPLIRGATAVAALMIGMCSFVAVTHLLKNVEEIYIALTSWLAGAAFATLVGIYLVIRYYLPELPALPAVLLGDNGWGIHIRDAAALAASDDYIVRISSFATEPRHLTYLFMPVICFWLVYLLLTRNLTRVERRRLWLRLGVVVAGFALTTSRSTYVLTVVAAGIVLWVTRRRLLTSPRTLIRAFVLLALATALMLGIFTVVSRRNPLDFIRLQLESLTRIDIEGSGVSQAVDGIKTGWSMFLSSPLWGQGWGSYIFFTQAFDLQFALAPNPNNVYLLMIAETGLIGLLILLWIFWRGLRLTFVPLPLTAQANWPLLYALGAALLATYACFMLWDTIHYTHLWMLLGLALAARRAVLRNVECGSG